MFGALILALSIESSAPPLTHAAPAEEARPSAASAALDVPFLHQTEALCGGAAAAMVFRYWGDRHATVEQFEPLVDRSRGGIAAADLADAVRQRWTVSVSEGSIAELRVHLQASRPVILLIEEHQRRLHYIVAVGIDDRDVLVHDPSWGPARRVRRATLDAMWHPTHRWMMVVTPASGSIDREGTGQTAAPASQTAVGVESPQTGACRRLLADALDSIAADGLESADTLLGDVQRACPADAGPIRELAGVRFAERRWPDAESLAREAVRRDPHDEYTWNLLASSRFVQDDVKGALDAWNEVGLPRLDMVNISGLYRTRYALVANALNLAQGQMIAASQFRLIERRAAELPDQRGVRVALRPQPDGFANVDIAIQERRAPQGPFAWAAAGVRSAAKREFEVAVPGWTGQGEVWEARWRFSNERPLAALAFAVPKLGSLPGVWRVRAAWEEQTYRVARAAVRDTVREKRAHGDLEVTDWLTPNVRYELTAGLDSWEQARRTASFGATIEHRIFDDRLALQSTVAIAAPLGAGNGFHTVGAHVTLALPWRDDAWHQSVSAGIDAASGDAPLGLWPGAGEGVTRDGLLRAHPLLSGGVIDGVAFGRRLQHFSVEMERRLPIGGPARIGFVSFMDGARAAASMPLRDTPTGHIDAGIGLRLRLAGTPGALRVDLARGLRDHARALTIGWQLERARIRGAR